MIFRQEIYEYQMAKFDKIIGSVELDESRFESYKQGKAKNR
ncbi:MAG: hypothetical protein SPI03_01730 [Campylobacter sputorum]|nr:hypothetical protein [Campylobacter sputorum]MDY6120048.1 hypothetical protein [Campylobacter sputorum]